MSTTNARRSRVTTLAAGTEAVILGLDDEGGGGLEGVTNGGSRAFGALESLLVSATTIYVERAPFEGARYVRDATSYTLPAAVGPKRGQLALRVLVEGYALRLVALSVGAGDVSVSWIIAR